MSQDRVDTDGLSQHSLLMLRAAGPPVCLRWLIFPAGFSFKALRWAFKRLLRRRWRPPSDFPSLSPPVRCPFQWLIYGPHKCARDAEISEEVINRTKPRKRGGKRKQTEEVTGTCRVKARAWERDSELLTDYFSYVSFTVDRRLSLLLCCTVLAFCLAPFFFSFLPVRWPLNSWWWVCLPVVCSPNWSQDADALAAWEQYSIYIYTQTLSFRDWTNTEEVKWTEGSQCRRRGKGDAKIWWFVYISRDFPSAYYVGKFNFWVHFLMWLAFQEMVLKISSHEKHIIV